MGDEIKMNCPHCAGVFNFPREGIGMTVDCPHCNQKLTLIDPAASAPPKITPPVQPPSALPGQYKTHHLRWLVAIAIPILVVLLTIGAFVHRANKSIGLHKEGIPAQSVTPIDGLFGIKLGEQLPKNCVILETDGELLTIIPPETNSAFETYTVTLNRTNGPVLAIDARGFTLTEEDHRNGYSRIQMIVETFQGRYGLAAHTRVGDTSTRYVWSDGTHGLVFTADPHGLRWITCSDDQTADAIRAEREKKQRASFDTKGLISDRQQQK